MMYPCSSLKQENCMNNSSFSQQQQKIFLHFQIGVKMRTVLSKVYKWSVNFSSCQDRKGFTSQLGEEIRWVARKYSIQKRKEVNGFILTLTSNLSSKFLWITDLAIFKDGMLQTWSYKVRGPQFIWCFTFKKKKKARKKKHVDEVC